MHKPFVQLYAIRAREFADAVARLGRFRSIGPEFLECIKEIERLHELCIAAARELQDHIVQQTTSEPPSRRPAQDTNACRNSC